MESDCNENLTDTLWTESPDELFPVISSPGSEHRLWELDLFNSEGSSTAPAQSEEELPEHNPAPSGPSIRSCSKGSADIAQSILSISGKRKRETQTEPAPTQEEEVLLAPKESKRKRGEHVRDRPDVQQTGRDGQKHWAKKLQELRAREWEVKGTGKQNEAFEAQLHMRQEKPAPFSICLCVLCVSAYPNRAWDHCPILTLRTLMRQSVRTRARLECLLRQLQLCAIAGEIEPAPFSEDERQSFLGWTGFCVREGRGAAFRRSIQSMFPAWGKNDAKTLNGILRDAQGGHALFEFQPSQAWGWKARQKQVTKKLKA